MGSPPTEKPHICQKKADMGHGICGPPAEIPVLAEPWFLTFNANVEFRVAMTPDDLSRSNLEALGKKWA